MISSVTVSPDSVRISPVSGSTTVAARWRVLYALVEGRQQGLVQVNGNPQARWGVPQSSATTVISCDTSMRRLVR